MNEPQKPKIGLLPLMLEMYKKFTPELEQKQKPFIDGIVERLKLKHAVRTAPVCTNRSEVKRSIIDFEGNDIDIIVILFIAYATSISVMNPLLETNIPLVLLCYLSL